MIRNHGKQSVVFHGLVKSDNVKDNDQLTHVCLWYIGLYCKLVTWIGGLNTSHSSCTPSEKNNWMNVEIYYLMGSSGNLHWNGFLSMKPNCGLPSTLKYCHPAVYCRRFSRMCGSILRVGSIVRPQYTAGGPDCTPSVSRKCQKLTVCGGSTSLQYFFMRV